MKLVTDEPVGPDLSCAVVIVMFEMVGGDSVTVSQCQCHLSSLTSQLKSVEEEILSLKAVSFRNIFICSQSSDTLGESSSSNININMVRPVLYWICLLFFVGAKFTLSSNNSELNFTPAQRTEVKLGIIVPLEQRNTENSVQEVVDRFNAKSVVFVIQPIFVFTTNTDSLLRYSTQPSSIAHHLSERENI